MTGRNLVSFVQLLDHLEVIGSGQIDGPRVPIPKYRFQRGEGGRADRFRRLQQLMNLAGVERLRSPELQHLVTKHAAVAQRHQFMKQRQRAGVGERGQCGLPGGNIDRRAGQHQFAHLGGKPRGIEQRKPATLTKPDQIDATAKLIDQHVEVGEIVVDA